MRRSRLVIVAVAAISAAVLSAVALADRPATTGVPGTFATINVRITDTGLTLNRHSSTGVQVIGFRIHNVGKKKHNFIVGDFATKAIAPGQFDDFAVSFGDFGKYLYRCTLNCPHSARGIITVNRGNFNNNG
jgi:plastocyanin